MEVQARWDDMNLQDLASPLLDLLSWSSPAGGRLAICAVVRGFLGCVALLLDVDNSVYCLGKDFVNTAHLLTTALDIGRAHALSYAAALLRCDGGQALRLEEFNAGSLAAEI